MESSSNGDQEQLAENRSRLPSRVCGCLWGLGVRERKLLEQLFVCLFLAMLCGTRDLSSLTRDRICIHCSGSERLHFPFSLSCIGEGNGNPLQCSCLENPRDGGAWWAAVYGVAQSRTRRKWQQQQWKCRVLTTGFYFNSLIGPLGIKDQRRRVYTPKALDFLFNFSESIFFCLGFQKTLKLQAKLGACVCVCVCINLWGEEP